MYTSHSSDGNFHRCSPNLTSGTNHRSSRARNCRLVAQAEREGQGNSFSQGHPANNGGGSQWLNAQIPPTPKGQCKGPFLGFPAGYPVGTQKLRHLLLSLPPLSLTPASWITSPNHLLHPCPSPRTSSGRSLNWDIKIVPTAEGIRLP